MKYGFDPARFYRTADPEMRQIASEGVLSQWRHFNRGPSYVRAGAKILYAGSDIIAWIESNRVQPAAA